MLKFNALHNSKIPNALCMGRKFGHQNFVEIQNLRRNLIQNPTGEYNAHIEGKQNVLYNLLRSYVLTKYKVLIKEEPTLLTTLITPRAYGKNSELVIDIKQTGKPKEFFIKRIYKDEKGRYGEEEISVTMDDSAISINKRSKFGDSINTECSIKKKISKIRFLGEGILYMTDKFIKKLTRNMEYEEHEGVSILRYSLKDSNIIFNARDELPTEALNRYAESILGPETTYKSLFEKANKRGRRVRNSSNNSVSD